MLVLATLVFSAASPGQSQKAPGDDSAKVPAAQQPAAEQPAARPEAGTEPDEATSGGEPGAEPEGDSDTGEAHIGKWAGGDPDQAGSSSGDGAQAETTPGEGPASGFEAYLSAQRTYPANTIPPSVAKKADVAFDALAKKDANTGDPKANGHKWTQFGPTADATQPGVTSFSGATNSTASRDTALVVAPDCGSNKGPDCRIWVGSSGGGVWRTNNGLADDPDWNQVKPKGFDQNSVGVLTLDPTDKKQNTLYLGTGEANRCSSGCEAGVGVYKSTNGGNDWTKLGDVCVSNPTYPCVTPGVDAFLGRAIRDIVIDPADANHIYVGSTLA